MSKVAQPRISRFAIFFILVLMTCVAWKVLIYALTVNVTPQQDSVFSKQPTRPVNVELHPGSKSSMQSINFSSDNPGNHLTFLRFDVMVKLVYAYYFSIHNSVPDIFKHAYKEHIRV